jgi:hypothetical protein
MNVVYYVSWTEYERGWGCRPDGYSFHATLHEANEFVKKQLNDLPKDSVPDCYSLPSDPELIEVKEDWYNQVQSSRNLWGSSNRLLDYKK